MHTVASAPAIEKLCDAVFLYKAGEVFTGQGIALCLGEDSIGNDFHLRHQLRAAGVGLEGLCSRRQVVMLNVYNIHVLANRPVDRLIDPVDDFPVMLRDVILKVDHDQCSMTSSCFSPQIAVHGI